ncbi:PEP-CTERM sorting domain-containing protein [Kiritimatiellota bacterium B12222]|nr:PEP-CTERM sorting domain-containing protein [Kiritimatiellota bacterium B12222]
MNILPSLLRLSLPLVCSATLTLQAGTISVSNYSFEAPDTDTFKNEVTDWIHPSTRVAVQKVNGNFPTAPDGDQWLIVDSRKVNSSSEPGYVFQKIGTIDEALTYTLDVVIGSRSDLPLPDNYIGGFFTDDNGVFSTGSGVSLDGDGTLATFDKSDYPTLPNLTAATIDGGTFWNAAGSGLQGEDLYIGFYIPIDDNSGNTVKQVIFDNVRVTTVPEPSSIILVLGGLLTLFAFKKR